MSADEQTRRSTPAAHTHRLNGLCVRVTTLRGPRSAFLDRSLSVGETARHVSVTLRTEFTGDSSVPSSAYRTPRAGHAPSLSQSAGTAPVIALPLRFLHVTHGREGEAVSPKPAGRRAAPPGLASPDGTRSADRDAKPGRSAQSGGSVPCSALSARFRWWSLKESLCELAAAPAPPAGCASGAAAEPLDGPRVPVRELDWSSTTLSPGSESPSSPGGRAPCRRLWLRELRRREHGSETVMQPGSLTEPCVFLQSAARAAQDSAARAATHRTRRFRNPPRCSPHQLAGSVEVRRLWEACSDRSIWKVHGRCGGRGEENALSEKSLQAHARRENGGRGKLRETATADESAEVTANAAPPQTGRRPALPVVRGTHRNCRLEREPLTAAASQPPVAGQSRGSAPLSRFELTSKSIKLMKAGGQRKSRGSVPDSRLRCKTCECGNEEGWAAMPLPGWVQPACWCTHTAGLP